MLKPISADRIRRFIEEAVSIVPRVEPVLCHSISTYQLSDAEADVLRRAVLGETREAIAAARSSSVLTVKRHVVNLLRRTRDPSMHDAVEWFLRELINS